MPKSMYEQIKRLSNELRNETKAKARRDKGTSLRDLLSKTETRRRLALEATPKLVGPDDPSIAAKRRHALSGLWSMVILSAINSVISLKNSKSKTKLQQSDIELPYRLLISSDQPDVTFDDAGLDIPTLPKKTVRSVLTYCLNMLADEDAIEVVEMGLLEMLNHMCSRPHHVGFFAQKSYTAIFEQLNRRLNLETERENQRVFAEAAKVLASLFQTCQTLGIEMNPYISDTIETISLWCKHQTKQDMVTVSASFDTIASAFFETIASILYSHPEKSIGPMKRFGRPILSYCKRVYSGGKSAQDAFNKYILAHIFLAQVKGKLQGSVDGDLGFLDKASLKDKHIMSLLDLVMSQVVLSPQRSSKQGRDRIWWPLDLKQRRHLEVVARLMAIAQRRYLVETEAALTDGDGDSLLRFLKIREEGTDKWSDPIIVDDRCPQEALLESPFMKYVVKALHQINSCKGGKESSDKRISLLSIICACSQLFPAGECWASSTFNNWHCLSPKSTQDDFLYCHCSAPEDLEPILTLLAEMLEDHGGPGGDTTLQSWILVTLSSLTETFGVLHNNLTSEPDAFLCLQEAWRRVWRTLFRSDLRYTAYTELSYENSLGDLVLTLAANMINMKCTDPLLLVPGSLSMKKNSFVYENQSQIWALPFFKDFQSLSFFPPFKLICSVLAVVGLSESGSDRIDTSLTRRAFFADKNLPIGRRKRLIYFCLGCLENLIQLDTAQNTCLCTLPYQFAAMAIFALVNGNSAVHVNKILTQCCGIHDAMRFQFTSLALCTRQKGDDEDSLSYQEAVLRHLWAPFLHVKSESTPDCFSMQLDVPQIISCRLRDEIDRAKDENADFIPESESNELRSLVLEFFDKEICSATSSLSPLSFSPSGDMGKPKTLSLQAVAVKFALSLNLFCSDHVLQDRMQHAVSDSVSFLKEASSKLASILDKSEFLLASSDLLRITETLVEISSALQVVMSVGELECTVEVCKKLLSNYFSKTRKSNESQVSSPRITRKEEKDDWFDEDIQIESFDQRIGGAASFEDSDVETSRKRKRNSSLSNTNRRQKRSCTSEELTAAPPDFESAKTIGLLLIALDPSPATVELVCQSLLATELDLDPDCVDGDMDLRLAKECLQIVSSKKTLFHSKSKEIFAEMPITSSSKKSTVVTFHRIVELIRACAGPSSPLYLHGNDECSKAIDATKKAGNDFSISEKEVNHLVDILKIDGGMQNRPYLRACRIKSATVAFGAGDEVFHQVFDKSFANNFVKTALQDNNLLVRRSAHTAVGYAVSLLNEERTVKSVLELLPPITKIEEGKTISNAFGDWYNRLGYSQMQDDEAFEPRETLDASEAMESDAIFCRSMIASSAQTTAVFQATLLEIMMTSLVRPDLEFVCFQSLERIAAGRKYSSLEEMVECESHGILKLWVETDYTEFPLALTAPNILRRLMISGWQNTSGVEGSPDMLGLRQEASKIFVTRHRHILIPLLVLDIVSKESELSFRAGTDEILQFLAQNEKLKAICQTFSNDNGASIPEMLYKLLRHHSADIQAFIGPILHCEDSKHKQSALAVTEILQTALTAKTVEERAKKKPNVMVLRTFELIGSSISDVLPSDESAYFRAILNIVGVEPGSKPSSTGDLFLTAGLNATENLVRSLLRLDTTNLAKSSWLEIKLQCKFIQWQIQFKESENTQLGFCIHVLTEAMLKPNLISLQPDILEALKMLLSKAVNTMKESELLLEVTPVIERLIGACMVVHESCQQIFLDHCYGKVKAVKRLLQCSCGLVTLGEMMEDSSAWGWDTVHTTGARSESDSRDAIEQHAKSVETSVRISMIGTYEVLELIFENEKLLGLKIQTFLSTAPPYGVSFMDLEALQTVNERFCAQSLARRFIEKQGHGWDDLLTDTRTLVNGLKSRLANKHAWAKNPSKKNDRTVSLGLLNVDQRLLYAELLQLERLLRGSELESVSVEDLKSLIRELSSVCGSSCPDAISFAASRCLGELDPRRLAKVCSSQSLGNSATIDWLETAFKTKNVLLSMQARSMESLCQCLQSSVPSIAMEAAETLGSLFCTNVGFSCWKLLGDESAKLLRPFADTQRLPNQSRFVALSQHEITLLKRKAKVSDDDEMWCWNDNLWKSHGETESSFEEWICILTSAIILCCFKPNEYDNEAVGSDPHEFIWRCQRMSLLDHGFASCIFQCTILILLNQNDSQSLINYNDLLSRSFSVLMEDSDNERMSNIKVLSFAIDTLHLLCRISLRDFMSQSHDINRAPRIKKSAKAQSEAASLPPLKQWEGLRFGVMMKLDGLAISRACIQAQRYASGLFFLDLYFNSKFGKAGGILEDLTSLTECSGFKEYADISGRGVVKQSEISKPDSESVREAALEAIALAATCLQELNEVDALDAIRTQRSALNFTRVGSISSVTDQYFGREASLDTLRFLNSRPSSTERSNSKPLMISECLNELGCHQILHPYIDGVLSNHETMRSLSEDTLESLREKWFQADLKNRQWEILSSLDRTDEELSQSQTLSFPLPIAQSFDDSSVSQSKSYSGFKGKGQGFFESLCRALDSFQDQDMESCKAFLVQGRSATLDQVARAGCGESPLYGLFKLIDRLRALRDVEIVATRVKSMDDLAKIWNIHASDTSDFTNRIGFLSTKDQETVTSTDFMELELQDFSSGIREIILRGLHKKYDVSNILVSHLWTSSTRARQGGLPNVAEASLHRLHSLLQSPRRGLGVFDEGLQWQVRLEEARLLECRGDFWGAIQTSKQLIDFLQDEEKHSRDLGPNAAYLLTDAQVACGCWMTKYKIQQAKIVLETYLRPGSERARKIYESEKSIRNAERSTHASLEFGETVSDLYEALSSRVGSVEWKQAGMTLSHQEQELQQSERMRDDLQQKLNKTSKKSKLYSERAKQLQELCQHCGLLRKDLEPTRVEREKIQRSVLEYLTLALESFTTALAIAATGIQTDLSRHVFRLISLWFSSSKESGLSESVNNLLREKMEQIPTFRFIPLTYQLVSRIEDYSEEEKEYFQHILQRLIYRMAADHPYHLLVPIIALLNGNNIDVTKKGGAAFLENVGNKKVSAANEILEKLKTGAPSYIRDMIESYLVLTSSYIGLALAPTQELEKKKKSKDIAFNEVTPKGSKVPALDVCLYDMPSKPCMITAPPPVRPGADYGDGKDDPVGGERIERFERRLDLTESGIHRPKIVICHGTKGGVFRQLVKGDDDLRQDAIMMQVFTYVNGLMMRRSSDHHRTNRLKIVTYNVLPMSPQTGVIEWVEDTIPLGVYEADTRGKTRVAGAHSKYYPGEWPNSHCHSSLGVAQKGPPEHLRDRYTEICQRHSPVLRFFFVERFGHCLQTWHTAKMNYTRSVAVSSIVGHILGIGDRHCKNILLHEKNGAVVHIDFGIVFEQGKLLSYPERVPFRLTRNVVDGMGPSGTEGTFVSSAEETIRVLRKNTGALLTILSAVVEDPLYRWNLTPVEARERQAPNEFDEAKGVAAGKAHALAASLFPTDQNKAAAMAVRKIKAKLQGYEDSTSGEQHGVLGQVLLLINSARDADNLCKMFVGWMPWV